MNHLVIIRFIYTGACLLLLSNYCYPSGLQPFLGMAPASSSCTLNNREPKQNTTSKEDTKAALFAAVGSGNSKRVEEILKHYRDVNQVDSSGDTPLIVAVQRGYSPIVELLLDHGADVNFKPAVDPSKVGLAPPGYTALHWAAYKGDAKVVKLLLNKRADVNVKSWHGITPLMIAASEKHLDVVKMLLNHGANVNDRDDFKRRAYARAVWQVDPAQLEPLRKEIQTMRADGTSVLQWAESGGDKRIIEILKKAGARY